MNAFAEIWTANLSSLYRSPLGYTFPYPEDWELHTIRSTIEVMPEDLSFVPIRVLSAQVNERDLSALEARLLRQIKSGSSNHVVEVRRLIEPRSAILVEVVTSFRDLDLQQYYVAELLDGGKLALIFILTALAESTIAEDGLLALWRDAEVPPIQSSKGFRKMALESLRVAFEFPADWVVQHASNSLIELRSPVRSSNEPNVIMEVEERTASTTLTQFTEQTLAFIKQEKLGAQNIEYTKTTLGNCPAMEIVYEIVNENQQLDHVLVMLPDPQIVSAQVTVRFAGLSQRWDDYQSIFRRIKENFFWLK